jgi:transcriptional regulator with XRE-family HTH domain
MHSDVEIGLDVKRRREELDLSIRELARRTGLSASFISQLEHGKTQASLESLRLIAEELGVNMGFFFSDTDPLTNLAAAEEQHCNDPAPTSYTPVVHAGCRPKLYFPDSGVTYELLINELNREMEAILGRISPGTGNVARQLRQPTEEFIFVISGKMRLVLEEQEYILSPGDSIYFEGESLREISCASEDEDTTWISVITPPAF